MLYLSHPLILDNTVVGFGTTIEPFCIVGKPNEENIDADSPSKLLPTVIGNNCLIRAYSTIYEGAQLEHAVICGEHSLIGSGTIVGHGTRLQYGAQIYRNVRVGRNCRIGGMLCNGTIVGENSNVYGTLVHVFRRRGESSRDVGAGPIIGNNCTVGFNSTVIGSVTIGPGSYIAAGAIVTRDVPAESVVVGTNRILAKKK